MNSKMNLMDFLKDIINLFEHEISLSTALLVVMKKEQSALSNNNLGNFEAAITEKKKLIGEVESTEKKLVELLKINGLTTDKQNLNALMTRCNPKEKDNLTRLLDKLKDIATQCHNQNLVNGKIIVTSNNNIQKIISILRGQPINESNIYNLSGKSTDAIQPQTLGRV